jgi:hypothetical protein
MDLSGPGIDVKLKERKKERKAFDFSTFKIYFLAFSGYSFLVKERSMCGCEQKSR